MSNNFIYNKEVQCFKKGKWRNYEINIEIIVRCQDKVMAILNDISDKTISYKFEIYGYEHNNDRVSLIGKNYIHLIKFESLDQVLSLTQLLETYIKDMSYKIQLKKCSGVSHLLILNVWYTIHVQTNSICFTVDTGSRLVTKWKRSNIGRCFVEDTSLNVEIIYKKEKLIYSFYRDELFLLEKLRKAIQNLKFEFPLPKPEKFTSTPRRSGSVDLKRITSWGSSKERIIRGRTYSSSRVDDSCSNDDSSPPSTPCTPSFTFNPNEPITFTKCYSHIDEKDEETDDLMFQLDSTDADKLAFHRDSKVNGYNIIDLSSRLHCDSDVEKPSPKEGHEKKYVTLERFPFEFDFKHQDKLGVEFHSQNSNDKRKLFVYNPNTTENSLNGDCYQTLDFLKHHRKTCSEANFAHHQKALSKESNISHSADMNPNIINGFQIPSTGMGSQYNSSNIPLSSSTISTDTHASSKSKDQDDNNSIDAPQRQLSPLRDIIGDHEYYNVVNNTINNGDDSTNRYPSALTEDSKYYNLSHSLSPPSNYHRLTIQRPLPQDLIPNDNNSFLRYIHLDFQDNSPSRVSKKVAPSINYTEISIHHTEVLKDLDDNMGHIINKKKGSNFLKSLFKK